MSVVLLSYDRPAYLAEALDSLSSQSYGPLEIIVVDNPSSSSQTIADIVSTHTNVKLIQNKKNLGYTGGMNVGIERATGDFIHLTEDDIVLDRDCLRSLVAFSCATSAVDLISPIIYNKFGRTIRCAGGQFELGGVFRKTVFGAQEEDIGQFPEPFEVGYIDGATMFARREFWREFGGFRAEYFMYVDSIELCARVKKSGKKMAIVPAAKVFHFEPENHLVAQEIEFHKLKNFFSLYFLHSRTRSLLEFLIRYGGVNGVRTLFGRNGHARKPFFKAMAWTVVNSPRLLRDRFRERRNNEKQSESRRVGISTGSTP